MNRGLL